VAAMLNEITDSWNTLANMRKRQLLQQTITFIMIIGSALMIWKGLMVVTGSESPIVVVLSGSMEPAFFRGDLLFLWLDPNDPIEVGDVTVFKLQAREIPIVHRVIEVHDRGNGTTHYLTKGDNNPVDDRSIYHQNQPGLVWLERRHLIGKAKGFLPYIGMVTIKMNEYPQLKFGLIALLGIFVLLSRE